MKDIMSDEMAMPHVRLRLHPSRLPHLGRRQLLAPHRRDAADRSRTNAVHVDPAGRWSPVALVWRPGQWTPIHSHTSWCVVGVHEGREPERTFRLRDGRTEQVGRPAMVRGEVVACGAGDDDIHEVANAGTGTTISLHVDGLDDRAAGSSILRTSDELFRQPA